MITQGRGSLLDAEVEAMVNTVNTVGVMGKGIALQFKRAYPEMFSAYAKAAKAGEVKLGRMHVFDVGRLEGPRYIINFPTKAHWRSSSSLTDIERGLDDLVEVVRRLEIRSIAVPPLGCGHGGLDWGEVEPLIRSRLAVLSDVDVMVYPPVGAPPAADMPSAGPPPTLTRARAALVEMVGRYSRFAVAGVSLIEVQKLMYFLQVAGEPLDLPFKPHHYGPYADEIRFMLRDVEGHYLVGFGDGSAKVLEAEGMTALPSAVDQAARVLHEVPETDERIERVLALTEGYESSYSMELLSTVHWIITTRPDLVDNPDALAAEVSAWSGRKDRLFSADHVRAAWETLGDRGWCPVVVDA